LIDGGRVKIRKRYLQVLVFLIHLGQRLRILNNVWFKAELDLADLEAKELMKLFGWGD